MNLCIIADATKCIGCRTCEVACAVSHQENQDCAALSPDEFISRIRVIKDHRSDHEPVYYCGCDEMYRLPYL